MKTHADAQKNGTAQGAQDVLRAVFGDDGRNSKQKGRGSGRGGSEHRAESEKYVPGTGVPRRVRADGTARPDESVCMCGELPRQWHVREMRIRSCDVGSQKPRRYETRHRWMLLEIDTLGRGPHQNICVKRSQTPRRIGAARTKDKILNNIRTSTNNHNAEINFRCLSRAR